MKYLFTWLILLPTLSFAQQLTKTELADTRKIIKEALADKTNYHIIVNRPIPDKKTAIEVAEPILFKGYGKDQILSEKPYNGYLVDSYWILSGTLPKGWLGGVFLIILSSRNGRVIKLIHGK